MPNKKLQKLSEKKVDGRRTVDHNKFCQLIVDGVPPKKALVEAGGKDGSSAAIYAQKLKNDYKDEIRQMALERASDGMLSMVRMAPKAVQVIEDALTNPEIKPIDRARLAKDVLSSVQDLLPKQTVHEHKHTHEVSHDEAEQAARELLARIRGNDGRRASKVVDGEFEEQSARSEDNSEGSGTEQE